MKKILILFLVIYNAVITVADLSTGTENNRLKAERDTLKAANAELMKFEVCGLSEDFPPEVQGTAREVKPGEPGFLYRPAPTPAGESGQWGAVVGICRIINGRVWLVASPRQASRPDAEIAVRLPSGGDVPK